MNKNIKTILFIALASLSFSTSAIVTIQWQEAEFQFNSQPRLTDVLTTLSIDDQVYWPSATLYSPNDINLEKTRQLALKNLSTISTKSQSESPQFRHAIEQLATDIKTWTLAKRLAVKIDFDLARVSAASNPKFDDGYYILHLTARPQAVEVFGAVNRKVSIQHIPYGDVSQYVDEEGLLNSANKDFVKIIQADGRIIQAPVAYWNKQHQEVMPGSQIYVPFKESIFSPEIAELNQQIVTLAKNRLPK
ncbi:capsule biosynthesis GfcC family protein [uncultured Paraglaciecola sp.]|uniref:capsule biosynthesis GfcC family protein n=1 Tax=uncultured Paraglaciecola sp. TaxID=1765024 RepID=UPI0030D807E7|tara:strand:+ start:2339 stop:3082 length:744 start_codon:yes stop_codon:yes gene_type:complete